MLIAFAHAWDGEHVKFFLETVRGHDLWQITDEVTPQIEGCKVFRFPRTGEGFVLWRARAYAAFMHEHKMFKLEVAFLDTDVLVRHDISPIMELDFDIVLTKTKAVVKDPMGVNLTEIMPYNGGVMFIKNAQFLQDVATAIEGMSEDKQKWYGDQIALKAVCPKYNMIELPNTIYNYKPKRADLESKTIPNSVWIAHFKGDLKQFMGDFSK